MTLEQLEQGKQLQEDLRKLKNIKLAIADAVEPSVIIRVNGSATSLGQSQIDALKSSIDTDISYLETEFANL